MARMQGHRRHCHKCHHPTLHSHRFAAHVSFSSLTLFAHSLASPTLSHSLRLHPVDHRYAGAGKSFWIRSQATLRRQQLLKVPIHGEIPLSELIRRLKDGLDATFSDEVHRTDSGKASDRAVTLLTHGDMGLDAPVGAAALPHRDALDPPPPLYDEVMARLKERQTRRKPFREQRDASAPYGTPRGLFEGDSGGARPAVVHRVEEDIVDDDDDDDEIRQAKAMSLAMLSEEEQLFAAIEASAAAAAAAPSSARHSTVNANATPVSMLSEEEQMMAAIAASLAETSVHVAPAAVGGTDELFDADDGSLVSSFFRFLVSSARSAMSYFHCSSTRFFLSIFSLLSYQYNPLAHTRVTSHLPTPLSLSHAHSHPHSYPHSLSHSNSPQAQLAQEGWKKVNWDGRPLFVNSLWHEVTWKDPRTSRASDDLIPLDASASGGDRLRGETRSEQPTPVVPLMLRPTPVGFASTLPLSAAHVI